jgi:hypothetical protein
MKKVFLTVSIVMFVALLFAGCGGKAKAQSSGGAPASVKEAPASDFTYGPTEDLKAIIIEKYNGKAQHVLIPATIEGLPVLEIGEGAFYKNETLRSVVIPEGVRVIKGGFFIIGGLSKVVKIYQALPFHLLLLK